MDFEQSNEQKTSFIRPTCCHWARTTNIGLLFPNVRNNIGGDIPIDVPLTKTLEGMSPDVSPAPPAGLMPVTVA